MKDFYEGNKDFKEYVDKYCSKHGISVDVALTHIQVRLVAEFYGMEV